MPSLRCICDDLSNNVICYLYLVLVFLNNINTLSTIISSVWYLIVFQIILARLHCCSLRTPKGHNDRLEFVSCWGPSASYVGMILSFPLYLQIFLVGICLPIYAIYSNRAPWNNWDTLATVLYGAGIVIAYFADTQLHTFMSRNSTLKELGVPPTPLLLEGLWRYSRHPNYFGEQLCWWGLAVYAWNLGQGWMVAGTVVNTLGLAYVTVMVERKMLEKSSRAELYQRYQETTSAWVPWFKFKPSKGAKDTAWIVVTHLNAVLDAI